MLADVNIVAGCTARKTIPVSPELELRDIDSADFLRRARRWIKRLQISSEPRVPAEDLYTGDAWQIIKPFGKKYHLWVASAGYGLVNQRTLLCSYSATFVRRHPDSVVDLRTLKHADRQSSMWWNELGKWQKGNQSALTITDLAKRYPRRPILVVLSPEYLRALQEDLCSARSNLTDPMRLIIISAGSHKTGPLADNFLPCDARFQTELSGSRISLNARIARKVLTETTASKLHAVELRKKFYRLLEKCSNLMVSQRSSMTDCEVINFIAKQLRAKPESTHSRLLRILREKSKACEQSRFKRLYKETQRQFL